MAQQAETQMYPLFSSRTWGKPLVIPPAAMEAHLPEWLMELVVPVAEALVNASFLENKWLPISPILENRIRTHLEQEGVMTADGFNIALNKLKQKGYILQLPEGIIPSVELANLAEVGS